MNKIHKMQMLILKELLLKSVARFSELNIKGLTSDHFSYHIKSLQESGCIKKDKDGNYSLTNIGKEFANTMDTDELVIEKQPKVCVNVIASRIFDNKEMLAIQRRLKEPFYGCQGFITGKVRFGEKYHETARRELKEELGLEGELKYVGIHHDLCYDIEGNLLEDKIFNIFLAQNCSDTLLKSFDSGENYWFPKKDFDKLENKFYSEDDIFEFAFTDMKKRDFYVQRDYVVEGF